MDDGLSAIIPSGFELPIDINRREEEEAEALDEQKRDQLIEESFDEAFKSLNVSDDDSSDGGESVSHSQSYENAAVKPPYGYLLPPIEVNHLSPSHSHSDHLVEQSACDDSNHTTPNHLNSNDDYGVSRNQSNRNSPEYSSNFVENNNHQSRLYRNSSSNDSINYRKDTAIASEEFVSNISANDGSKSISSTATSALLSLQPIGTQEDYIKQLQKLYEARGQELRQIQEDKERHKDYYESEINDLKLKLMDVEDKNNKLSIALNKSDNLVTDYKHDNICLKGKLSTIEVQLSAEKKAKESALEKLEGCEITNRSLEKQINDFTLSGNAHRLKNQNERVMKDLKLRHQKEILQLKEEIDKLRESLDSTTMDLENTKSELSKLKREYEELQMDKNSMFNELSTHLKVVQKEYKELLESGNQQAKKISDLKHQNQTLQENKLELEKQNSALKDDIRVLKSEIRASEALKKVENEIGISQANPEINRKGYSQTESSLRKALQEALKNEQSLREQNHTLLGKLQELKMQLEHWEEKAKFFESCFNESVEKSKELEKKLKDVLPDGSIPIAEHEAKLNSLKMELMDLQKNFHDVSEKLKSTSSNEKKLSKESKILKNKIAEMLEDHSVEKIKAVKECREKYIELHQNAVKKLNEELTSKADEELKSVCKNYENKISELQTEVKSLSEGLYDAKAQYVTIFEENKLLQSKLDFVSKPKDQQDMENELRTEYEKKLNKLKEQLQQQKNYFENLEKETEKTQEEWTKQKMAEIKEFINSIKQRLDEEFVKCLEKEKSKFQSDLTAEKERLAAEYQEKINALKLQYKADNENMNSKLRESFEIKWKNEIKELQQSYQQEMQSLKLKYETRISVMEQEIDTLKENLTKNSSQHEEIKNKEKDIEQERQAWKHERLELINAERAVKEKLTCAVDAEKKLRDKVKRYQKYTASLEKKYQTKMNQLISQNDELYKARVDKEKELLTLKEKFECDIFELEKKHSKQASGRNMGSQTEEDVISKNSLYKAQHMFTQTLRKITEGVNTYLVNYRKRTAEHLQKALYSYQEQLVSKLLIQDVIKSTSPFPSSVYIHHTNLNSHSSIASKQDYISPSTVQQQPNENYKISNSTPYDRLASGDICNAIVSYKNDENTAKIFHNAKSSENRPRFEDISYDFVPIRMPDSAFMSTKLPEYHVSGGLFSHENIKNSYPERLSPVSSIK